MGASRGRSDASLLRVAAAVLVYGASGVDPVRQVKPVALDVVVVVVLVTTWTSIRPRLPSWRVTARLTGMLRTVVNTVVVCRTCQRLQSCMR